MGRRPRRRRRGGPPILFGSFGSCPSVARRSDELRCQALASPMTRMTRSTGPMGCSLPAGFDWSRTAAMCSTNVSAIRGPACGRSSRRQLINSHRLGVRLQVGVWRPGLRENECVGLLNKVLYDMAQSTWRASTRSPASAAAPTPTSTPTEHCVRATRYFDILHRFMGYRTCYYRTFAISGASRALVTAYRRCRYYLDAAIALIRPGASTGEVVSVWPRAQEFGFPDEEAAFALQFGHWVGLSIWESRSSAGPSRSSTRRRSAKAWFSRWRPSSPRATAGRPRGSRSSRS
jgi:hypothetical protein